VEKKGENRKSKLSMSETRTKTSMREETQASWVPERELKLLGVRERLPHESLGKNFGSGKVVRAKDIVPPSIIWRGKSYRENLMPNS